ncbi:MAG: helicase-related protein [Burkholderiaceae bacterium]
MVIIDEAHYLRNQDTQTYRLGKLLRPVAQHMVMLSATPIQLRNRDLFNLVHLLDEDAFPYERSFEWTLRANAPIVDLRDRVLSSAITQQDFVSAVATAQELTWFEDSEQLTYLRQNPPSDAELASPRGRAEVADQLDRVNPLSKVVTRTLKRDVQINRVERLPVVLKARMSPIEENFYNQVTAAVQDLCEELNISEGFLLTIPQRQMASSMAAACEGWKTRVETAEGRQAFGEAAAELDADIDDHAHASGGTLINELRAIAHEVGDATALAVSDSKFELLHSHLVDYWRQHPGKKVVLFSFYRATLYYLQRRLASDGIQAVVLHGGMDKQQALEHFERADGPHILLSSEVASEGVDLQFSSLLINYDLPWNPARIEQRIGRIDRIGQQEEQILIWNLVYEDSIDDRVYERLLDRLGAFRQALGSMEAVLGEEMRKLAYELLSHRLTPEQMNRRIDSTAVAIENTQRHQIQLESEAANLIAHGEYIQNKVRAADEVGRYIRGEDLLAYVRDFFLRAYPGTRLIAQNEDSLLCRLELSTDARVRFADFIQAQRLQGRTTLQASSPLLLRFDNRKGKAPSGVEIVGQDHPLVRFVGAALRQAGGELNYHPVAALELHQTHLPKFQRGAYVYVVMRWSVSVRVEIERLEYMARSLDRDRLLDGDQAEQLVNMAALKGSDWLGAADQVDSDRAAALQDECRTELDERFRHFVEAQQREDADRVRLMVSLLEQHLAKKREQSQELILRHEASSNPRRRSLIPAVRGRLQKEENRVNEKIAELRLKTDLAPHPSVVSSGVIRIS